MSDWPGNHNHTRRGRPEPPPEEGEMSTPKLKTFIIEEVASYYVRATNRRQAERKFLDSIACIGNTVEHTIVHEREVYPDPENSLVKKEGS
jgi:hypothetical protein